MPPSFTQVTTCKLVALIKIMEIKSQLFCCHILLAIFLQAEFSLGQHNVSLQTFKDPGFKGQSEPVVHYEPTCFNLQAEIKSVKSSSCVMLYTDENCEGYSRKIDVNQEIENLGSDNYFGHFFYQIKSVHACNKTLGGNTSFVDIYDGEYPEGDLLARFENIKECTQMVNVTPGYEVSMDNHGNCIRIYTENNCTGPSEDIPGGYHPLYHPLSIIITEKGEIWKTPIVRSFEPCEKYIEDTSEEDEQARKLIWILSSTGALVLLAIIIIFGCLVWKIRHQNSKIKELSNDEIENLLNGDPELLNNPEGETDANNFAKALPYDSSFELESSELVVEKDKFLGKGAFGIVYGGTVCKKGMDSVSAAVKTVIEVGDLTFLECLVGELKMMIYIGPHPNIVNLLGAQTRNIKIREVYIATEYCGLGNLQDYLIKNREKFACPNDLAMAERGLNMDTLTKWAYQVANGMEFLSQRNVVHRDLAARNVLLTEDLNAKISDFGLSRKILNFNAVYIKMQQERFPWKWLAVECLSEDNAVFSVKSDVWAFGILLFEIFSLGRVPYPACVYSEEFIQAIQDGTRPHRPPQASDEVFATMTSCWQHNPEDRHDFTLLRKTLKKILDSMSPYECVIGNENHEADAPMSAEVNIVKRRTNAVPV